jgi:hypothetical protein
LECRKEGWHQAAVHPEADLGDPIFPRSRTTHPGPSPVRSGDDSKLRGCDLVKIRIRDVVAGPEIRTRAIVVQQKTGRPVQLEITADVRASLLAWLERRGGTVEDYAFPNRVDHSRYMSTRQYARLVDEWVIAIGLRSSARQRKRASQAIRPTRSPPGGSSSSSRAVRCGMPV